MSMRFGLAYLRNLASIQEKINSGRSSSIHHTAWLHLLERWRERLLADETAFTEFGQQYPNADLQRLRILVRIT